MHLRLAERNERPTHRAAGVADPRADDCDDSAIPLDRDVAQRAQIHEQRLESRRIVDRHGHGDLGCRHDVD